ncbi:RNA methyltransferase, TrmA family [Clostridiaceae bacterium JG1575]|nr:RNA methyltransferase, TrmA family [Clostridiaceae bacterium JG1575]
MGKPGKKKVRQRDQDQILPVQKNDMVEAQVLRQGNSGEGVLYIEEYPLFIPQALPGEWVRARVLRTNRTHGFARLSQVISASIERRVPPCPYYGQCGGCHLQHQSYEGQLEFKRQRVVDCLERIGGFSNVLVEPTLGMEEPWHYRNKVQMPLRRTVEGVAVGFYQERSQSMVDIAHCLIQPTQADAAAQCVRSWINDLNIPTWSDQTQKEVAVRHLLLRRTRDLDQIMVVLVANSEHVIGMDELVKRLREALPALSGVLINVNPANTNRILGPQNILVYGKEYILDSIGETRYRISPHSFFQVNSAQTKALYDTIRSLANFQGSEHVLDLYCGAGSISLYIAPSVAHVTGVEVVAEAVEDAKFNQELNQVTNATFRCGKSEEVIEELLRPQHPIDVVIVDPPRKGCDASLLNAIGVANIPKIIYVSCDPATLARDLALLATYGYQIQKVQPVDNFPQTDHVETVVLMSRVDK